MAAHAGPPPSSTPLFLKPRMPLAAPGWSGRGSQLSSEQLDEVRFSFDCLDYEKRGSVTPKQLKVALRALGFPCRKADVLELLRRQGEEESERLEWESFLRAVSDKMSERSPLDDFKRAFRLFDLHGQGKIDLATLRKVVKSLDVDVSEQELHDMIAEFDTDKDGLISESEFMAIMASADDTL